MEESKIEQIDNLLGKYYARKGRKDYYDEDGIGKFAAWYVLFYFNCMSFQKHKHKHKNKKGVMIMDITQMRL